LQKYVGWTAEDARRIRAAAAVVEPVFDDIVEDFYDALEREPETRKAITGGQQQIARLKTTLREWLAELFSGQYDEAYVARRWRVGWRHVEIGLEQVYVNAALARLRQRLIEALEDRWRDHLRGLQQVTRSLNRLLDLELAIIQDAYERESIERQKLAERIRSETAFKTLVESAGCMIVMLREDHSIAYLNPFTAQVTGRTAEDVIGKDYFSLFLPTADRPGVANEIHRILAGGEPTRNYENTVLCRDGTLRWVVWHAQRLDNYRGQPAVLAIGQDITETKRTEQRSLQTERLAAIGQMITGLAHESRNAFQRSQACLETLAMELEDQPDELELVARTQRSLEHLHHLYEEVRDYAAPVKLDREPCNLSHVWRDAWSHLDLMRAGKQLQLRELTAGLDLACEVDWFAMGQAFRNILENAIDACPDPGEIVIHCEEASIHEQPAIQVAIRDDGPGFHPSAQEKVFEPFFTTKSKGTGLGMAITRRIVEAHGGEITIGESKSGAEILMTLPRSF
jgi:PAS domain S-box-containing protein